MLFEEALSPSSISLRPTGLSPLIYRDQLDYEVLEDGRPAGRMYEDLHALPELRWFWSITVFVGHRAGVTTNGERRRWMTPRRDFWRIGARVAAIGLPPLPCRREA